MKNEKMNTVKYSAGALIITIPSTCPEETHHLLMKGLAICLRQNITSDDKRKDDVDGLVAIAEFMQLLIPGEV